MGTIDVEWRTPKQRLLVAVVVAALAAALTLAGSATGLTTAGAATAKKSTAKVSNAEMTWTVSGYVMGANPAAMSLAEVRVATAPATFDGTTGWTFEKGKGTYDTKSGATTLAFKGGLEFGNTAAGNYGFKFDNPVLALDATGTGTLTVDFSSRPVGGGPYGAVSEVVVVDITGATPITKKTNVTITAAPTAFAEAYLAATADLSAFFKATGSSNDGIKAPAPITVEFSYKVAKPKS